MSMANTIEEKAVAAKDKEIEVLKETIAAMRLREFNDDQPYKAENKRLRKGIESAMHHGGYFYANGHGKHHGRGGELVLTAAGKILQKLLDKTDQPDTDQLADDRAIPTMEEIHFVAVDESHADRHGWQSLNQKPAYVDGFEDGSRWAIKRIAGMEVING